MATQQEHATQPSAKPEPDIKLPGDRPTELFVLGQCVDLVIHRKFTKNDYKIEVLQKDVDSLSELSRDVDASYYRRLDADQGLYGDIDQIPHKRIHLRPPNILVFFVAAFTILGLVAYGQSSPIISSQFWYVVNNYGWDIVVGVLLVLGLFIWIGVSRRRRKGGK